MLCRFVLSLIAFTNFALFVDVFVTINSAEAAKRKPHVVIQKPALPPPIPVQPIAYPVAAIPPLAIFYDLNRRINCLTPPDPLGLGGPGFDGKPTPPSNVMIPCYERRLIAQRPAPKR